MITITENEFQKLSAYINKNFGIKLSAGKKALLQGRLQQVLIQNGFESFSEYYRYLVSDTTGVAMAVLWMGNNKPYVFYERGGTFLERRSYLESSIPTRISGYGARGVRQEAYTIAMVVTEYLEARSCFGTLQSLLPIFPQDRLKSPAGCTWKRK